MANNRISKTIVSSCSFKIRKSIRKFVSKIIEHTISFKENSVDDVILYNFLDEKSKIIGKSAYIKSLLKEKLEQEREKDSK